MASTFAKRPRSRVLSKFATVGAEPGSKLLKFPFHGYFGQVAGFSAIGITSVLPTNHRAPG